MAVSWRAMTSVAQANSSELTDVSVAHPPGEGLDALFPLALW